MTVQIISVNEQALLPSEHFEALIDLGHSKKWTMYSMSGVNYEAIEFDIDFSLDSSIFDGAIHNFQRRSGITISVMEAYKEGLKDGFDIGVKHTHNVLKG